MLPIIFSSSVLEALPLAEPGQLRLQRRASAPELLDLYTIYRNTVNSYEVGNMIRLQLLDCTATARIVKTFAPFSMAQVMVLSIFESAINLEGDFVLKVYDHRYADEPRNQDRIDRWNQRRDMEVEKSQWSKKFIEFFSMNMANENLGFLDDEPEGFDQGEQIAYDELYCQAFCLKMYRAELEVYRQARQHGIDGTDMPRFISSVRISPSYHSKFSRSEGAALKGVPGILIQYLPGFPLQDLYDSESPPAPRSAWQSIVDDGVRIVQYINTKMNFINRDVDGCRRNTIIHWDPIRQRWKLKMISFGHCMIRKEGTSDWEWRRLQAQEDEEGAIGLYTQSRLKKNKDFDCVYQRSQYYLDLSEDFLRATSEELEDAMSQSQMHAELIM